MIVTLLATAISSLLGHEDFFLHGKLEADPEKESRHLLLYTHLSVWNSN